MVDTKSPGDKTLSVPTKTLTLKPRVETGTVRQSFSHGRTKQVVVEKRGKRRIPGEASATETAAAEPAAKIIIDLEQLQGVPADKAAPLARYAATIQSQRGDYNGRVLSIRQEDLRSLAVIYDASPSALTEQLIGWGVLSADARRAIEV